MIVVKKSVVFEGKYLRMVDKVVKTRLSENHIWETVERTNIGGRGAVVVVALTKEKEIIFERNWRAPVESFVIQFPAGVSDIEGETDEDTARRELLEETGYLANTLIPVIVTPEDPVLIPTQVSHFLAPEVAFIKEPESHGFEEIEVLKVPTAKIKEFLLDLPENTSLDLRVPGILWILESQKLIQL